MKILSIDAWGNQEDGYEWNAWYTVGNIDKDTFESLDTDQKIADYLFENDYITSNNLDDMTIEDDQYNIVIKDKETDRPLFAIEYGPEY